MARKQSAMGLQVITCRCRGWIKIGTLARLVGNEHFRSNPAFMNLRYRHRIVGILNYQGSTIDETSLTQTFVACNWGYFKHVCVWRQSLGCPSGKRDGN